MRMVRGLRVKRERMRMVGGLGVKGERNEDGWRKDGGLQER